MLGLRIDKIDKKALFDILREKISIYILRTVTNPESLVSVVSDMIDRTSIFDNSNNTKDINIENKTNYVR